MRDWSHPLFSPVLDFQQADGIIIAAPYWDLSFPSILKVWVENMYVRNLTFYYNNNQCVGLIRSQFCCYITTAGSPIGQLDFGTSYIQGVTSALGNKNFYAVKAEALDLVDSDTEAILKNAENDIHKLSKTLLKQYIQ